jgi:hypothetical protein
MTDPGILRPRILKRTSETKLRRRPPDQNTCGHFVHNVGTAELAMPSSSPGKPVRPNLGSSRPSGKVRGPSPMWPLRRQEERSLNRAARLITASNDEVERRAGAQLSNETVLSQSSTPSLAYRSCAHRRSLEPIVRQRGNGSSTADHSNPADLNCIKIAAPTFAQSPGPSDASPKPSPKTCEIASETSDAVRASRSFGTRLDTSESYSSAGAPPDSRASGSHWAIALRQIATA